MIKLSWSMTITWKSAKINRRWVRPYAKDVIIIELVPVGFAIITSRVANVSSATY